jgi:hypothetical protein
MVKEKKVVLMCGGGTGCVTNIICDRLMSKSDDYFLIVAGRTPMEPRDGVPVPFVKYDIFEEGSTENLIKSVQYILNTQHADYANSGVPKKVTAIVNSISTGGKVSYDTSMIAFLNYVSMNVMVHLSKTFDDATLVHMSSLKVGNPEDFDHTVLEKGVGAQLLWKGARSPYAWSKLAAELKLLSSDLKGMSFIRIGLMESPHAKKFYTRVRAVCDFPVAVTQEAILQNAIEDAIVAKGRHIVACAHQTESNVAFYKRMSGRWFLFQLPLFLFNFIFGNLLPTKMIDYVSPNHDFKYMLPF